MSKIILPKIYENEGGKYPQYTGKPKLSYSQKTSFEDYKYGYLRDYILGFKSEASGIFAEFGSACGNYLAEGIRHERLSDNDIAILDAVERPKGSEFEVEIVIDRGHYVIQGFIDLLYPLNNGVCIDDFKTVTFKDRLKKYGDLDKYWQTRIYAYALDSEGYDIKGCGVLALGRKGNVPFERMTEENKHNILRLSGEKEYIPTPYNRKEVENYLKKVDQTVEEISEYYKVYNKIFAQ